MINVSEDFFITFETDVWLKPPFSDIISVDMEISEDLPLVMVSLIFLPFLSYR